MSIQGDKADSAGHRKVDDILESFEDAWEAGRQPSIDACLPADGKERLDVLFELIHVDLERRIQAGIATRTEDYLHRFPELESAPERLVEVIAAEIRLRRGRGESLATAGIEARFPLIVEQLRNQLALEPAWVACERGSQAAEHKSARAAIRHPTGSRNLTDQDLPVIAGYSLRSVLGRGGAAVVYLADQHSPRRQVAIKMLHGASGQLQELAHRLQAEAQALAQLQHPHIVQVFEVGQYQGQPFLVMEYLSGGSLQDQLVERPLDSQEAAVLVQALAKATEVAHNRGIIHRDLKPSNVLFDAAGNCKITDFGLAKQLGTDQLLTQTGEILGTPSFMAPEQALAAHGEVGPRTDVYALGAILYVGLTGRPPFKAATLVETLEQVRNSEPVRPSALVPKVPRDLETICLKCLEKPSDRRYATASALAADLERLLNNKPILARPVGQFERALRWSQRNRLAAAMAVAVLLTLALASGSVSTFAIQSARSAVQAKEERDRAIEAMTLARRNQYFALVNVAQQAWEVGNVAQCLDILGRIAPQSGGDELRGFEYRRLKNLCHRGDVLREHTGPVMSIAQSTDGNAMLSGGYDGKLLLWNPTTGAKPRALAEGLDSIPTKPREKSVRGIRAVALSSDGKLAASATLKAIQIWDVASGNVLHAIAKLEGDCFGMAFSPDGSLLAAQIVSGGTLGDRGVVAIWDTATGLKLHSVEPNRLSPALAAALSPLASLLPENITALAFSPDGSTLAVATGIAVGEGTVSFWDVNSGRQQLSKQLKGHNAAILALAFSDDGKMLATGSGDQTIIIWNIANKSVEATLKGHRGFVTALKFLADGKQCVSGSADHTVRRWDIASKREIAAYRGHVDFVTGLLISPDQSKIISASGDQTIRIWPVSFNFDEAIDLTSDFKRPTGWGIRFAEALASNKERPFLVPSISLAPDGNHLAAVVVGPDNRGTIEMRDRVNPETRRRFLDSLGSGQSYACSALSPDGRILAAGEGSFFNTFFLAAAGVRSSKKPASIVLWRADTGQVLHRLAGHEYELFSLAFSECSELLATGDTRGAVNLWTVSSPERKSLYEGDGEPAADIKFSPDGRFVAAAFPFNNAVRIWEIDSGKEVQLCPSFPSALAFSPDGSRLAVGGGSFLADRSTAHGEVEIWNWRERRPLGSSFKGHTQFIRRVFYTAAGERLWSVGFDGTARLWDLATRNEILKLSGDFRYGLSADLSRDGNQLVIGTETGRAILWDAPAAD